MPVGSYFNRQSCRYEIMPVGKHAGMIEILVAMITVKHVDQLGDILTLNHLDAKLFFANLPAGARLFCEPVKRRDPSRALMPVTK